MSKGKRVQFSEMGGRTIYSVTELPSSGLVLRMEGGLVFTVQPSTGHHPEEVRLRVKYGDLQTLRNSFLRVADKVVKFSPTEYDVSEGVCYIFETDDAILRLTWEAPNGYSFPVTVTQYDKGQYAESYQGIRI